MRFEDWWEQLPDREQRVIGYNNAKFVWNEHRRLAASTVFLDEFSFCDSSNEVIIFNGDGEGGRFNKKDFEEAVRKFFNDNF
jgi:hypothetical protein